MAVPGKRIKECRERLGLTQKQLGDRIGAVQSTVSGYENDARQPDGSVLAKLADLFDVTT